MLDPVAVRERCCAPGARDHGITGTGIDMSLLFTEQAKFRAENSVSPIKSSSSTTMPYVSDEKVNVAACVGATWIGGKSPP